MSLGSVLLFLVIACVVSPSHADMFVLSTIFEEDDANCSTWYEKDYEGVQDACQSLGDPSQYGISTATGKYYTKRTCTTTHFLQAWYDEPNCTTPLEDPPPQSRALACAPRGRGHAMYSCNEPYTAARWSVYTDTACQTKDNASLAQVVPVGFCRARRTGRWEFSSKGRNIVCGASGLVTTLWENSDCGGSSTVKNDTLITSDCNDNSYHGGHVKIESGCDVGAIDSTSSSSLRLPGVLIMLCCLLGPRNLQ